jgi:hypothetical protein
MRAMLRRTSRGVCLLVRVTPKSSRDEVTGIHRACDGATALSVKVTAAPDRGKANAAVVAVLADALSVAKSQFSVVSGETNRNKTVLFTGDSRVLEANIAALVEKLGERTGRNGQDH